MNRPAKIEDRVFSSLVSKNKENQKTHGSTKNVEYKPPKSLLGLQLGNPRGSDSEAEESGQWDSEKEKKIQKKIPKSQKLNSLYSRLNESKESREMSPQTQRKRQILQEIKLNQQKSNEGTQTKGFDNYSFGDEDQGFIEQQANAAKPFLKENGLRSQKERSKERKSYDSFAKKKKKSKSPKITEIRTTKAEEMKKEHIRKKEDALKRKENQRTPIKRSPLKTRKSSSPQKPIEKPMGPKSPEKNKRNASENRKNKEERKETRKEGKREIGSPSPKKHNSPRRITQGAMETPKSTLGSRKTRRLGTPKNSAKKSKSKESSVSVSPQKKTPSLKGSPIKKSMSPSKNGTPPKNSKKQNEIKDSGNSQRSPSTKGKQEVSITKRRVSIKGATKKKPEEQRTQKGLSPSRDKKQGLTSLERNQTPKSKERKLLQDLNSQSTKASPLKRRMDKMHFKRQEDERSRAEGGNFVDSDSEDFSNSKLKAKVKKAKPQKKN